MGSQADTDLIARLFYFLELRYLIQNTPKNVQFVTCLQAISGCYKLWVSIKKSNFIQFYFKNNVFFHS